MTVLVSFLFAKLSLRRIAEYGGWWIDLSVPYQQIKRPEHKKRFVVWIMVLYIQMTLGIELVARTLAPAYDLIIREWNEIAHLLSAFFILISFGIIYHYNLPVKPKKLIPIEEVKRKRKPK